MPSPSVARARKAAASPAQLLPRALTAFQQGRAAECIALCEAILAKRVNEPAALHLLGAGRLRLGDSDGAARALTAAAKYDPCNAEVHANLGAALRATGDIAAAVEILRRAIALQPKAVPAHYNLGNALAALGRHEEAIATYAKVVALDPAHAAAHNNLGLALQALGRRDDAVAAWRRSVAIAPKQRDAHLNLGRALMAAEDFRAALAHFDAALAACPGDPDIHNERGVVLLRLERIEEAIIALRLAVDRHPDHVGARVNLGNALCLADRAEEGVAELDAARAAAPEDANTLSNLGAALETAGRLDRAYETLSRALALQPDHGHALNNMGQVLRRQGCFEAAVEYYDRAVASAPDNADARFGHATANLALGRFGAGWQSYLARPNMAGRREHHREPLPDSLAGSHVLVEGDQGLGDEIFFLRFLAQLRRRGARVSYRPDSRLADMLRRSDIAHRVLMKDDPPDTANFHVVVGDLPYLLGHRETEQIPPSIKLRPLADREAAMRDRLASFGSPPYFGLSWRAGTRGYRKALFKEAPWAMLAETLRETPGTWIALQRAPDAGEMTAVADTLQVPVYDMTALNDELESMLAILSLLDDYVCVSNTNVHLRAACGRTCRILLPHPPEFRWMAHGAGSPWFPGTTIYRQRPDGDWGTAFAALRYDLAACCGL